MGTVAFTEEASFTLRPLQNHTIVWRHLGKCYVAKNSVHPSLLGYVSLSIWRLFSARGRSQLFRIRSTLNQLEYIEILRLFISLSKASY